MFWRVMMPNFYYSTAGFWEAGRKGGRILNDAKNPPDDDKR